MLNLLVHHSSEKGPTSLLLPLVKLLLHLFFVEHLARPKVDLAVRTIRFFVILLALVEVTVKFAKLQLKETLVVLILVEK